MFYISCILFILLNCVKVCDCHTFNKRLLTYLLTYFLFRGQSCWCKKRCTQAYSGVQCTHLQRASRPASCRQVSWSRCVCAL